MNLYIASANAGSPGLSLVSYVRRGVARGPINLKQDRNSPVLNARGNLSRRATACPLVHRKHAAAGARAGRNHEYMRSEGTGEMVDVSWMELPSGAGVLNNEAKLPLIMQAVAFPYEDPYHRLPGTDRPSDIMPHTGYRAHPGPTHVAFRVEPFTGMGTNADKVKPARTTEVQ